MSDGTEVYDIEADAMLSKPEVNEVIKRAASALGVSEDMLRRAIRSVLKKEMSDCQRYLIASTVIAELTSRSNEASVSSDRTKAEYRTSY
jgi:hypothetical protein